MKKVLKVILYLSLFSGIVAYIVCMCAIPSETKEFFNYLLDILDRPIVLCGVSITIGGVLLYFITRYILSNTSFGKKRLNDLNDKLIAYSKVAKDDKETLQHNLSNYEKVVENAFKTISDKCDLLENALKQVPNKKVQEVLNNGKENKDN